MKGEGMTKLLEQGIEAVRRLPDERQDMAGELLLAIAEEDGVRYRLTPEQIEEVKLSIAEADRGEFVSDEEMAELWKKFGLAPSGEQHCGPETGA
jgi:predicted transcriptional regulator